MRIIERQICETIKKSTKKCWNTEGANKWTIIYKKALANLGHRRGYEIYGAPRKRLEAEEGEWLYDLCWAKEGRKGKVRLGLITEIEWNYNKKSILDDFSKLTVGIADYRLMVTWHTEKGERAVKWRSSIVRMCKEACPAKKGFRYLLIITPKYNCDELTIDHWVK